MSFVLVGDPYNSVPSLLLSHDGGFSSSPEYAALAGAAEDLPGVTAAAFARYVGRQAMQVNGSGLRQMLQPLNVIASWNDWKTDTMLKEEVLSQFEADRVIEKVRPFFSPELGRLIEP